MDRELFERALETAPAERQALLAASCPDPAVRARVQALLEAHDRAGDEFLERPAAALTTAAIGRAGRRLGAYVLERPLGRGGMGAVYLASRADAAFEKKVAIKIVAAPLGDEDLAHRFRRERQILAELEHPFIARLLDGGTTDEGLPYLVMEFVDGLRIDEYCRRHDLDTRARLELFLEVCEAVQYAHAHLIVHRDLKPQNVLVAADGSPRLLDFGIATLAAGDEAGAGATLTAYRAMTPGYASPEQLRGERVSTASDVYSLGVLLYELLAGERPYDLEGKSPGEVQRLVSDTDPAKPSSAAKHRRDDALARRLYGDLDAIVMTALRKEPSRRYASVAFLADDVRRHLDGRPVAARGEALGYRARTFVRRHRLAVAAAALLFLTLTGGIVATSWQGALAERARADAVRERDRAVMAEQVATTERDRAFQAERAATEERSRAEQERSRAEQERNRAVEASRRADTEAAIAVAVREFLANDVLAQASANAQAAGRQSPDPDLRVREALDRAAQRVAGRFDAQPAVEAAIRQTMGIAYKDIGLFPEAEQQLVRALELRTRVLGANHVDTLTTLHDLGIIYVRQGRPRQAEPLLARAVRGFQATRGDDDRATLGALNSLSIATPASDRAPLYARILNAQQRVLGEEHPDTLSVMHNLAVTYVDAGKYGDGERLYLRLVAVKTRVLGAEHPSTLQSMNALGVTYRYLGRYREAESMLSALVETRRRTLGPEHPETQFTTNSLGLVYAAQGRFREAESLLVQTLETRRRLLGEHHPTTLAGANNVADVYRKQRRYAEAEALFRTILEVRRRELGGDHPSTANVLYALGELKLDQQQPAEAEPYLAEALSAYQKANTDTWRRYFAQSLLGVSRARLKRFDEAEPLLVDGHQGLRRHLSAIPAELRHVVTEATTWLADLYRDWGKPEKAAALLEAAKP